MPLYSRSITVPANTPEGTFPETTIALSHGVITRVIFRPRPGHSSLLHLRIFRRRSQIFPHNTDDDLHGDADPVQWNDWYEIFNEPFALTLMAWNDDILYQHTFDIAFAVLPRYAALPFALAKAIGELITTLSPKKLSIPAWLGGKKVNVNG